MPPPTEIDPEPRWPALVALLAVGGLNYALPPTLSPGPGWLIPALVLVLLLPALALHRKGYFTIAHALSYTALGSVTLGLAASLALLVKGLPSHAETPKQLLISAAALWVSNLLIFASWYWRLDAGGPHQRDLRGAHTDGAFLFPQMMLDPELRREMGEDDWRPGFVDYLFLAFNTSTAFSPTDVPVLSRWAKLLMMLQASISLATLAILAARAVNIL
ncbi:MAG TPA: hypothetical protein VN841_15090 [Bryobacteraceae bacterium]|nr:hypothetical protein [Bryobacteraceae bacterium]